MKLFASGCSFTWGGAIFDSLYENNIILDENNNSSLNKTRLEITWPGQLSKLLNCSEFHNHSMGCGSNNRIIRKTFNFFLDKIQNGEDLSEWIAIIQWTEPSRFEFFDEKSKSWAIIKSEGFLTEIPREINKKEKDEVLSQFFWSNDTSWEEKHFNEIITLGNFFKIHDIKYLFTAMMPPELSKGHTQYCNKNFVWYNNDIRECSISKMNDVKECSNSSHPSMEGHNMIAKKFYKFIDQNIK